MSLKKSFISYSALLSLFSGISNVYAESYQVSGNASATGTNSIAIGDESRATATGSVALGYDADSINFYTTAIGFTSEATLGYATALGAYAEAEAEYATAIGAVSGATGSRSTAIGYSSSATALGSTALGMSTDAGYQYSTAIGYGATTDKANQIVLGRSDDSVTIKGIAELDSDLTVGGNLSATSGTSTFSNVDINGGNIDGTAIGSSTASSGAFTSLTASSTLDVTGDVDIDDTTQSTSTTTGALKVDGGVGIAKNLNVGGTLGVTGATTLTGALTANGGITTTDITATGTSTITTADINGGNIDGTEIGANSAAAGTFTNLTATGTSTITTADINGGNIDGTAIGSSTASSGAFTTLSASGSVTLANLAGSGSGCVKSDNNGLLSSGSCGPISEKEGSSTTSVIGDSTRNIVQIGSGTGATTIDQQGISTSGKNLIKRMSNGEVHIGENSLITKENNGKQELYAKGSSGSPIPINITNGSKLLINGRDVEQSINNVGALSAALTGLPTVSIDSKLSCGIGTGAHGGNVAFAGGCASKINENLAFNAAASFVPGQDYQGDFEDSYSVRAGFIFKIGKDDKTTLVSKNKKKDLLKEIAVLKSDNEKLKESNRTIFSLHKELLAKFEKLETIASNQIKNFSNKVSFSK